MEPLFSIMFKELFTKLDKYPHVQQRLTLYWGSFECRKYLQELLLPDRTDRQGFPYSDIHTITALLELHDEAFPKFKPNTPHWSYWDRD